MPYIAIVFFWSRGLPFDLRMLIVSSGVLTLYYATAFLVLCEPCMDLVNDERNECVQVNAVFNLLLGDTPAHDAHIGTARLAVSLPLQPFNRSLGPTVRLKTDKHRIAQGCLLVVVALLLNYRLFRKE